VNDEENIIKLAETLKERGIAISMAEAMDKAKSIIEGTKFPEKKAAEEIISQQNIEKTPTIEEKEVDPKIDKIDKEVSALEAKQDFNQQKLHEEGITKETYDVVKDDITLNEIMKEAEKEKEEIRENEAEPKFDEYSEEDDGFSQNVSIEDSEEPTNEFISESGDEEKKEEDHNFTKELLEEEKETPKKEGKEKGPDLTDVFNVNK